MKKSVLAGSVVLLGLLGAAAPAAQAQTLVDGGTYKLTHYGVPADNTATAYGVPAGSPLCLDVNENKSTAGAAIAQWGDNGIDAQRFIFEKQTDGSYKLRHKGTVMYMQPVGLSKVAGTPIEQNVLLTTGDDAQRWLITDPLNNGRYKLMLKNSANAQGVPQVLEVGFGSPTPGAPVNLWDDNGFEQAQRWELSNIVTATKNGAAELLWVQAYPNPLTRGESLNLRVEAKRRGPAAVAVVDVTGRTVYSQQAELQVGGNAIQVTNASLAPGLYLVRIQQGDFVQQTRIVQQ